MYNYRTITGTQAKSADKYAINTLGIPSLTLMANASWKASDEIMNLLPDKGRIAIFCGVGNNGADGLNVARILLGEGYKVKAFICGTKDKATDEFLYQLEKLEAMNAAIVVYSGSNGGIIEESLQKYVPQIAVDSIFGIGLHRPVSGLFADFMAEINNYIGSDQAKVSGLKVVAVDIPSGINADTGELMGMGIKADITVTFGCNKTGLLTGAGAEYAGQVMVRDIGIPDEAYERI